MCPSGAQQLSSQEPEKGPNQITSMSNPFALHFFNFHYAHFITFLLINDSPKQMMYLGEAQL